MLHINDDILGNFEFACKIAGAKLIIILGHKILRELIDTKGIGLIDALYDIKTGKVEFNDDWPGTIAKTEFV